MGEGKTTGAGFSSVDGEVVGVGCSSISIDGVSGTSSMGEDTSDRSAGGVSCSSVSRAFITFGVSFSSPEAEGSPTSSSSRVGLIGEISSGSTGSGL